MYLEHFGLNKDPFHITPDPYFFYMGPSHKESYASLIYGLKNRKGFISLTGEVGLGKTTIVRTFLSLWNPKNKIKTVFVFNPNVSFKGLLLTIYSELGVELPESIDPKKADKHYTNALPMEDQLYELVHKLHSVLIEEYQAGYNVILIIDDAQNMPIQTLENLRMLSNLETSKDKLLQIFLIGQTELDTILNKKELRQLRQRIAIRTVVKPFSLEQTRDYISHRLHKAGAKDDQAIFTKSALKKIQEYSGGIPRKINIICDNALITGFGYGRDRIDSRIIREVHADLEGIHRKTHRIKYALAGCLLAGILGAGFMYSNFGDGFRSETPILSVLPGDHASPADEEKTSVEQVPAEPEPETQAKEPHAEFLTLTSMEQVSEEQVPAEPEPEIKTKEPHAEFLTLSSMKQSLTHDEYSERVSETPGTGREINGLRLENLILHQQLEELIPAYSELSATRQEVLVRMTLQTSIPGLLRFRKMLAALENRDFEEAAQEMVESVWARTIGERAYALAEAMRTDQPTWLRSENNDEGE